MTALPGAPPPLPGAAPRWRQALILGGVFALAGPAIAGLLRWLVASASMLASGGMPWYVALSAALTGVAGTLAHSVVLGAVPAFITGCVAGWWRPLLWRWQSWPALGLLALLSGAAGLSLLPGPVRHGDPMLGLAGMAAPTFVAGTLLAWLCRPRPPGRHG